MKLLPKLLILFVAIEHSYILYLEMFAWTSKGPKTFRGLPKDMFEKTKGMAANQGLYNGFLAAGLIWSLTISEAKWQQNIAVFFLSCVIIAGIYGAYSVQKTIFYVQAVPALLALLTFLCLK
jgi:putative membrane protein